MQMECVEVLPLPNCNISAGIWSLDPLLLYYGRVVTYSCGLIIDRIDEAALVARLRQRSR